MQSVIRRYQQWSQGYVEIRGTREGPSAALPTDITVHPAMYALLESAGAAGQVGQPAAGGEESKVRVSLSEIADQSQQFVLLGEPGSGKTSHLQWLALKHARLGEDSPNGECTLPVLIDLGAYDGPLDVVDFVKGCLRDEHGVAGAYVAENLPEYLDDGRLLFLLDGLNQIPADRYRQRIDRLRAFADANSRNKFVFTCRALDYEYRFGWPRVVIAPLEEAQVEEFVTRYLPETGAQLMQELRYDECALLDLAANPFMLRMMTLMHGREGRLPKVRPRLLQEFAMVLLARERGELWVRSTERASAMRRLASLAFAMTERGLVGTTVKRAWAEGVLREHAAQFGLEPAHSEADLLKLGADASLLAMSRSGDTLQYWHELLQEYFSALVLVERSEAGNDLAAVYEDCWWQDTVAFACALVQNPDQIILGILRTSADERGPLLAGACCAEAHPLLAPSTVGAVVSEVERLLEGRIGPLGTKAMDTIARIDYSRIEDMVLKPSVGTPMPSELQVVELLGARHGRIVPVYMGPFFWATRDCTWEPRAYAASIVRTRGSDRITEHLLALLGDPALPSGFDAMIAGVLADMAPASATEALMRLLASGSYTVRMHAARGLANIAAVEAEPLLAKILADPSEMETLREACAMALLQIAGVEAFESLAGASRDSQTQQIALSAMLDFESMRGQSHNYRPPEFEEGIASLAGLDPSELLRRIIAVYKGGRSWLPAETYPLAAALALTAGADFLPHLRGAQMGRQGPVGFSPDSDYKIREAVWWIIGAICDKRRRRGRTPNLSPYARDWSAFGAPPR